MILDAAIRLDCPLCSWLTSGQNAHRLLNEQREGYRNGDGYSISGSKRIILHFAILIGNA